MNGRLFFSCDNSQRGRFGHIDLRQKWCVEAGQLKIHIDSYLNGFTATLHIEERPSRKTIVTACDGSCQKSSRIPAEIWEVVVPQIQDLQKEVPPQSGLLMPDVTKEQLEIINSAGDYYSGA